MVTANLIVIILIDPAKILIKNNIFIPPRTKFVSLTIRALH